MGDADARRAQPQQRFSASSLLWRWRHGHRGATVDTFDDALDDEARHSPVHGDADRNTSAGNDADHDDHDGPQLEHVSATPSTESYHHGETVVSSR